MNYNALSDFDTQLSTGQWGPFELKYESSPGYDYYDTPEESYTNEENNMTSTSAPQYRPAVDSSFNTNQRNVNSYGTSFNSLNGYQGNNGDTNNYRNNGSSSVESGPQHNYGNSNNFLASNAQQSNNFWKNVTSRQDGMNSNFYGSQSQSQTNSYGTRQYKSFQFDNKPVEDTYKNSTPYSGTNSSNYSSYNKFKNHFANKSKGVIKDNTPAPALFMGRDDSYPKELNDLLNPFFCGVCKAKLNSIKCSNIHYESKAHGKQVLNWLKKSYAEKGLPVPEIRHFSTDDAISQYRCELCKLDLTSAQHALQHYNGRKHRHAASKISPPSGIGYYDVEGKWTETGKVFDKNTGKEATYILVSTPSGSEPVVLHVAPSNDVGLKRPAETKPSDSEEQPRKKVILKETPMDMKEKIEQTKKVKEKQPSEQKNDENQATPADSSLDASKNPALQEALKTLQCKICSVVTTSYDQMLLHLKGSRHAKKLRALGEPPIAHLFDKISSTILDSLTNNTPWDVSMYRTPSGSYYCKTCDVGLEDIGRIKKHISSKVHLANVRKAQNKQS